MPNPTPEIDLRGLASRERDPLVFSTFDALPGNGVVELVNDAELAPLQQLLRSWTPGRVGWEDVESGPGLWRARVTKLAGASSGCCGGCGGGGHA